MYKKGEILNGKYRIERTLGRGGTSSVYLCTNLELDNLWAVKHVAGNGVSGLIKSEIEILKKLNHINLPQIADFFQNEEGLFIVESYIEGISLDKLLRSHGSFEIEKVVDWSLQLCDIFEYLHGLRPKPIIYGDMKPSNIIVSRGSRIVLVDFGISREYENYVGTEFSMAGTEAYAAPEQFIKGGVADQRTDIYNMGATMYQLLYGRLPKEGLGSFKGTRDKIQVRLGAAIAKCLESRKEDRYRKVEDIKEELQAIRDMLILRQARQRLLLRLEVAAAAVLSLISYTIAALGLANI